MAKQLNVDMRFTADTAKAKQSITELQAAIQKLGYGTAPKNGPVNAAEFERASKAARELAYHLNNAYNAKTGNLDLSRLNASLKQSGTDLTKLTAGFKNAGQVGQQAFAALAKAVANADQPAISINTHLSTMFTTLKNVARFQLSSSIMHGIIGGIQTAVGYAQDLNQSLNNIRIVTGQSTDQMARFAEQANKTARSLSASTLDYTNASLIYYQQGLDDQAVKARTDVTVKLANVSRQSAEEVSSQMTAIWNNFDDGAHSMEYFADVITALGATTASSSEEIATGLSKFAPVAGTIGLSYEKASAALAAIIANTRQSADTVGTGLRTIFSRFESLKLGETLEDGVDLNKYTKAMQTIGVNVLDANGKLRDMDSILDDIATHWDKLDNTQKTAFATTVGGVRQYTNLMALFENWDDVQKNMMTASGAEGTLQKQADIYAESWEAARKRVKAAAESIYDSLIDDNFFIGVDKIIEHLLVGINKFIESFGGIKAIAGAGLSFILAMVSDKIGPAISKIVQDIQIMSGGASKVYQKMQGQFQGAVEKELSSGLYNDNPVAKAQLEASNSLLLAKTKLGMVNDKLSAQEKMQAEIALQGMQAQEAEIERLAAAVQKANEQEARAAEKVAEARRHAIDIAQEELQISQEKLSAIQTEVAASQRDLNADLGYSAQDAMFTKADAYIKQSAGLDNFDQIKLQLNQLADEAYSTGTKIKDSLMVGLKDALSSGSDLDFSASLNQLFQFDQKFQIIDSTSIQELEAYKQQIDVLSGALGDVQSYAPGVADALRKIQRVDLSDPAKAGENFKKALANLRAECDKAQIPANKLTTALKQLGGDSKSIEKYVNNLKKLEAAEQAVAKADAKLRSVRNGGSTKEIAAAERELAQARENGKKAAEDLAKAQQQLKNSAQGFNPEHAISGLEGIAKTAAGLGQVNTAINSIKSALTTLGDSSATIGEKLSACLMAVSFGVPAAIGAINNLQAGFAGIKAAALGYAGAVKILTASQLANNAATLLNRTSDVKRMSTMIATVAVKKGLIAASAKEALVQKLETLAKENDGKVTGKQILLTMLATIGKEGETVAHGSNAVALLFEAAAALAAETAMSPLLALALILTLAIAALAAVVFLLVKAFNAIAASTPEGQLKSAKQATEDAAKAAEEAKDAYDKLVETFDKYKNAKDKIASLTKGTEEFRQAVEEANEAARELIRTYGLTKFSVDSNGVIQIDEQEYEAKRGQYGKRVDDTRAAELGAENQYRELQNRQARSEMYNIAMGYSSMTYMDENGQDMNTNEYLTGSNIAKVQAAVGTGQLTNADQALIAQSMGWIENLEDFNFDNLTTSQQDFINTMIKASGHLTDLGNSIQENNAAIEAATKLQLAQNLADNEAFQNSSHQNAIINAQTRNAEDYRTKARTRANNLSGDELYKEYERRMGYQSHGIGTWMDGKETFYDKDGNQVADLTDAQIRAQLAEMYAQENMETAATTTTLDSINNVAKILGKNENLLDAVVNNDTSALTLAQMSKGVDVSSFNISDEDARNLGYESAEAFKAAMTEIITQANEQFQKSISKYPEVVQDSMTEIAEKSDTIYKNVSQQSLLDYGNTLESILNAGGQEAVAQANDAFTTIMRNNSSKADDIMKIANGIDWTSEGALDQFNAELQKIGIFIDKDSQEWQNLVNSMGNISIKLNPTDVNELRTTLTELAKLAKDIKIGSIISDEDYEKLIALKPELADLFMMTTSGRAYIGSEDLSDVINSANRDAIQSTLNNNQQARSAVQNLSGWGHTGDNGWEHAQWGNHQGNRSWAASTGANMMEKSYFGDLASAAGINEDELRSAFETLQEGSNATEEELARAQTLADQFFSSLAQLENDAAAGLYDDQAALEMYASSFSDVDQMVEAMNALEGVDPTQKALAIEKATKLISYAAIEGATSLDNFYSAVDDGAERLGSIPLEVYAEGLANLASQYDNCADESHAYSEALENLKQIDPKDTEAYEQALIRVQQAESKLRASIRAGEYAKKYNLDAKALERFADELRLTGKYADITDEELIEMAKDQMRFNRGVEDASKNMSTWRQNIKKVGADLSGLANAYGDILDINGEMLSTSFLKDEKNLDLLDKIASGQDTDGSAYNQLLENANQDFNVQFNLVGDEEIMNKINNIKDAIADVPEGVDLTANLDGVDNVLAQLSEIVNAAGMTAEQATAYLASMGIDATVVEKPTEETDTVAYNITPNLVPKPIEVSGPPVAPDGTPGTVEYTFPEVTYTQTPVTGTKKTTGVALEVTSANKSSGGSVKTQRQGGGGGGSGGGGGGGDKLKKKDVAKPDTGSRYHTIKAKQSNNANRREQVSRQKERAFGAERIRQAQKEIDLQKEQITLQRQYITEIEKYLTKDKKDLQEALDKSGLTNIKLKIDADGVIENFQEVEDALLAKENDLIAKYNNEAWNGWQNMTNKFGEAYESKDEWFEEQKEKLEALKEAMSQYEETQDLYEEQLAELKEQLDAIADAALELLSTKIQLHIDVDEDELALLEFMLKAIDDNAYKAAEAISLFGQETNNFLDQIDTYQQGLDELFRSKGLNPNNLDQYSTQELLAAGFTQNEIDKVREWRDAIISANESLLEMRANILDKVITTFQELNSEVTDSYDLFDHYNDMLENYKNITDTMGKHINKDQRKLINDLNKAMLDNSKKQLETSKQLYDNMLQEQEKAKKAYDDAVAAGDEETARQWKEILDEVNEATKDAQETWMSQWEETTEMIQEIFETMLDQIVEDFNAAMGGAFGSLDYLSDAFERKAETDELYLQDFDKLYELNKLQRDLNKVLSDTRGVTNRKEMLELQKEITAAQEAGVKLSQYDVDVLRKKFELQNAYNDLQLARDAKSTVRLQRDREGNWGYVYTADEDKVAEAEQAYEDKLHEYQKLNDDYIKELQEKALAAQQTYRDTLREIMEDVTLTDEERQARIDELNNWYLAQQKFFEEQSNHAFENQAGTLERYLNTYTTAIDDLISTWERTSLADLTGLSTLDDYMNNWMTSSDAFLAGLKDALDDRKQQVEDILALTGTSIEGFGDQVSGAIDDIGKSSSNTQEEVLTLAGILNEEFNSALEAAVEWEQEYADKIINATNANIAFAASLNEVIKKLSDLSTLETDEYMKKRQDYLDGKISEDDWFNWLHEYYRNELGQQPASSFDTGGYTGIWGSEGRLAFLHEKEQIFNQADTANLLAAAKILRTIDLQVSRFSNGFGEQAVPSVEPSGMFFEQSVHITAEFPNATNHAEIEEAFNNLANKATQYANRKNI